MMLIKGDNVLIHVITLTFMCPPPVFHTYRGAADCHSHCFITPPQPICVCVPSCCCCCCCSDSPGYHPAADCTQFSQHCWLSIPQNSYSDPKNTDFYFKQCQFPCMTFPWFKAPVLTKSHLWTIICPGSHVSATVITPNPTFWSSPLPYS